MTAQILPALAATADRTWPVLLFLCLVTVVAELADDCGLFDVTGHWAARVAGGSVARLLGLVCLLATVTTVGLSLDTTVVLVTPVAVSLVGELGLPRAPFVFACVWLANGASLLLPISNLTNLLAQHRLGLSTQDYVRAMTLPQAATLTATLAVLWWRHRRLLRGRYAVPRALPDHDPVLVAVGAVAAGVVAVGALLGLPAWSAAGLALVPLVAALAVRRREAVSPARLLRLVPWRTAGQTLVLFAVVAVAESWVRDWLAPLVGGASTTLAALLRTGATSAVAANLLNNLPAYLLLEGAATSTQHLLAVLVGVGIGPQVLLWGSVANLLWRDRLRAGGQDVTARDFAREGMLLVPLALAAGLAALSW